MLWTSQFSKMMSIKLLRQIFSSTYDHHFEENIRLNNMSFMRERFIENKKKKKANKC